MALQDLTPQLRTRLNRMERAVGWFVMLATALLVFGFGYYIYNTAESKGWFKTKAVFYTYADDGAGFSVGDNVKLMGFNAGRILEIQPMPPWGSEHNIYVKFEVLEPNFGYLWTVGSRAKWAESGFLGKRELNVTKGVGGHAIYLINPIRTASVTEARALPGLEKWRLGEEIRVETNVVANAWQPLSAKLLEQITGWGRSNLWVVDTSVKKRYVTAVWNNNEYHWEPFAETNLYELPPEETPSVMVRLQNLVSQVETALPHILDLTNQISAVLSNSARLTSNLDVVAENARPLVTNLSIITANIRDPHGSLGEWLIPTNTHQQLDTTLLTANVTLTNIDTNLVAMVESVTRSLDNLSDITSNLNHQVQVNSNILSQVSGLVVNSDQFVQGLKRFWLFRHLFKAKNTNAPPAGPSTPQLQSPKAKSQEQ